MIKIIKFQILYLIFLITAGCSFESPIIEWKDGIIPFYLSGDFTELEIDYLDKAMARWEGVSGVRFEEVTPRSNAYEIIRVHKTDCWRSSIGENNVKNYMHFCDSLNPIGHILHELGHCMGLLHEHQRPDRDKYVLIIWDKILPEYEYAFEIRDNPLIIEEDFLYDFSSIMHYHSKGFSIDGSDTIVPLDNREITRSDDITSLDAQKARDIYPMELKE